MNSDIEGKRGDAPVNRRILSRGGPVLMVVLAVVFAGCASSGDGYINPNINFGQLRRAAVVPFQNLSGDELGDERIYSVFLMELLREDVLEITDPGETVAAMRKLGVPQGTPLAPEQVVELGRQLRVDALFFGIIEEYGVSRVDPRKGTEVTAAFGMFETETGSVVWRTQVHTTGSSTMKPIASDNSAESISASFRFCSRSSCGIIRPYSPEGRMGINCVPYRG